MLRRIAAALARAAAAGAPTPPVIGLLDVILRVDALLMDGPLALVLPNRCR